MQKKDKTQNLYFENPARFADLINACTCHGTQILQKEHLRERKQIYYTQDGNCSWNVIRDVVKEAQIHAVVILIGIENQSETHFAMPLRVMKDDVTNYMEQWKKMSTKHKQHKDLKTTAEYLSGLSEKDRFVPVLTYCIYWGEEEWHGPRCLKDMLDLEGIPEEFRCLIADYPLNLIEVNKFQHTEYFQTDLRIVFEFLQNRGNYEHMKQYLQQHKEELNDIPEDTYELMCELSNIEELKDFKDSCKRKDGEIDMCRAFEEWAVIEQTKGREIGRNEGHTQGLIEGHTKGLIEGHSKGLIEGHSQGLIEGRTEAFTLAETILKMRAVQKNSDEIAAACQISTAEVEVILDKLKNLAACV